MIRHYFKIAWRNLLKYKVSSFIGITGLSVGFLCFIFCAYYAGFILKSDKNFKNFERLARIEAYTFDELGRKSYTPGTNPMMRSKLQDQFFGTIECLTATTYVMDIIMGIDLENKTIPYKLKMIEIDTNFNKIFDVKLLSGNWESIHKQKNSVVISQSSAKRIYGDITPIGKLLHPVQYGVFSQNTETNLALLAERDYFITGIIEDIPVNTSVSDFEHLDILIVGDENGWLKATVENGYTGCTNYALLKKGKTLNDVNELVNPEKHKIKVIGTEKIPEFQPINNQILSRRSKFAYISLMLGCLIFLTSILNFIIFLGGNLLTRVKEFKIRQIIGSNYLKMFFLLYTELLVYLLAVIIIIFLLINLLPFNSSFTFSHVSFVLEKKIIYLQLLTYLGYTIILFAIICLFLSAKIESLSVNKAVTLSKGYFRNSILTLQMIICVFFFTVAVVIFEQSRKNYTETFHTLTIQEKECILEIDLDIPVLRDNVMVIINKLKTIPEILDILYADNSFFYADKELFFKNNRQDLNEPEFIRAGENFHDFLKLNLISGKLPFDKNEIVVDSYTYDWYENENLINSYVEGIYNSTNYLVTGVMEYIKIDPYKYKYQSSVIWSLSESPQYVYIKTNPENIVIVKNKINDVLAEFSFSNIIAPMRSLQERIESQDSFISDWKPLLLILTIISLIITLLGLYSTILIDSERRRKEVAIRKINCADTFDIIKLFVRKYAIIYCSVIILLTPLLYFLANEILINFSARINLGFLFWLKIYLSIGFIILLSIAGKIHKILHINPAEVIKDE